MSEYVGVTLPVFAIKVAQVVPPSVDLSILYPVMAEPPLFGAVQLRLICEDDTGVAVRPEGADGAAASVIAEFMLEGELVPTALIAETLYA